MKKPKMLIAGGGHADIPLILAAKRLGYYVITTGNIPYQLGHNYSDDYINGDFSDKSRMYEIAKNQNISAICPSCNDFSALSCAFVAEKLGLPGHDSYRISKIIHHKDCYRKFALKNGIPTPDAKWSDNKKDAHKYVNNLKFPLIVKPVDLTGGKGISKIYEKKQVKKAVDKAFSMSKAKRVVIEEFLEGSHHAISLFLRDGKVVFHSSEDEGYYLNPYLVSAVSTPAIISKKVIKELCHLSEKIAKILFLKTGILHIQYILSKGKPFIIEITRRAPGDLYIRLVEIATGAKYSEWIVKGFAGLNCDDVKEYENKGYYTKHCIMPSHSGILNNIKFAECIKQYIIEKFMWWHKGDKIIDYLTTNFGIVFLKFDSKEKMIKLTKKLPELIHCEIC